MGGAGGVCDPRCSLPAVSHRKFSTLSRGSVGSAPAPHPSLCSSHRWPLPHGPVLVPVPQSKQPRLVVGWEERWDEPGGRWGAQGEEDPNTAQCSAEVPSPELCPTAEGPSRYRRSSWHRVLQEPHPAQPCRKDRGRWEWDSVLSTHRGQHCAPLTPRPADAPHALSPGALSAAMESRKQNMELLSNSMAAYAHIRGEEVGRSPSGDPGAAPAPVHPLSPAVPIPQPTPRASGCTSCWASASGWC